MYLLIKQIIGLGNLFCCIFTHAQLFLKFIYYFITHFLPFITHAYNQSYDSE